MKKEYYPDFKYTKPKSAKQGQFIVKSTRKPYKGIYVYTSDKRYFSGNSPIDTGVELEEVLNNVNIGSILMPLVAGSLGGYFAPKPTKNERSLGILSRYFIQDRNNGKILEVSKQVYLQTQKEIPNKNFAQVDWNIKGPAEDKMFGKYSFEGAESKNRKAIQAIEPQIKGITTFIVDYSYLVEKLTVAYIEDPVTESFTEKDITIQLENDRKANFDLRK